MIVRVAVIWVKIGMTESERRGWTGTFPVKPIIKRLW